MVAPTATSSPASRKAHTNSTAVRSGPTADRLGHEIVEPVTAQSLLVFRGHLRAENLNGHASLSIRCDVPGHTEILSGAKEVTGTTGSISQVLRFTAAPRRAVARTSERSTTTASGLVLVSCCRA